MWLPTASGRPYLDRLLRRGHDAFPHEQAIIIKEPGVLLSVLLALVNEELDESLLQNVPEFPRGECAVSMIPTSP